MISQVPRVKPKRIDPDKWYIVDIYLLHRPYLLWNEFKSKKKALYAVFHYLKNKTRYSVTSGSNAIKHRLIFYWDLIYGRARHRYKMIYWVQIHKYNYDHLPNVRNPTRQVRSVMRRKLKKLNKYKPERTIKK